MTFKDGSVELPQSDTTLGEPIKNLSYSRGATIEDIADYVGGSQTRAQANALAAILGPKGLVASEVEDTWTLEGAIDGVILSHYERKAQERVTKFYEGRAATSSIIAPNSGMGIVSAILDAFGPLVRIAKSFRR